MTARHGLKIGAERGLTESWVWNLNPEDESMPSLSLRKSKSVRATRCGAIVAFRDVIESAVFEDGARLVKLGQKPMHDTGARNILILGVDPWWQQLWAKEFRLHTPNGISIS